MADSDDQSSLQHSEETLENWVNPLIDRKEAVNSLLQDVSEASFGKGDEAREKLKDFATESLHRDAFSGLHFTLQASDAFFEDVEELKGEDSAQYLKQLSNEYSHLQSLVEVIYNEIYYGYVNPIDNHDTEIKMIDPTSGPVITLRCYSGETLMSKQSRPPSGLLNHSASILGSVNSQIENFDDYDSFTEDELENISDEIEHASNHIDELRQTLDEIKGEVGEGQREDVEDE